MSFLECLQTANSSQSSESFGSPNSVVAVPQHQREKSVDLLNQPDMLAALLGPSQAEDDWASPAAYHTHTRQTSRHDDFDVPAMVGDNVDGDMVIPEPVPYTEPEPEPEPYYEDEPAQLPASGYEPVGTQSSKAEQHGLGADIAHMLGLSAAAW